MPGAPHRVGLKLAQRVADRRAAYQYWFTQSAPDAIDAQGVMIGRARVVLMPAEASTLQPGDILVTRATDPGWTPVFSIIAAAVLEIGGTLSHGAIVAREYGLPAVVNVPQATQRIRDGQLLQVDGTQGKVWLR